MGYIDRLNAFYRWKKTNHISGNASLLYYEILGLFNEAGWPESIQLDNYRLMWMVDTRTERVAIAARDKLVELGFIEYKKGRKGSPNQYILTKYTLQKVSENDSVSVSENDSENDSVFVSESSSAKCSHIKTKTKKKTFPPKAPQGAPMPSADQTGFEPVLQKAFEEWLSYKRERREAYKPTGLQSLTTQIRKAAGEYGAGAVASLIQQSMASGYRGILFDRLAHNAPFSGDKAASQGNPGGAFPDYSDREGSL